MHYTTVSGPGERIDGDWGDCVWYMEVNDRLEVVRQLEVYENGNILAYETGHEEDQYGGLGDAQLEWLAANDPAEELGEDYSYSEITSEEFERVWAEAKPMNRGAHPSQ